MAPATPRWYQPSRRSVAARRSASASVSASPVDGVGAQQVVQDVAAAAGRRPGARAHSASSSPVRLAPAAARRAPAAAPRRKSGAGREAEQPEQPPRGRGQCAVGQVERGPDGGLLVALHRAARRPGCSARSRATYSAIGSVRPARAGWRPRSAAPAAAGRTAAASVGRRRRLGASRARRRSASAAAPRPRRRRARRGRCGGRRPGRPGRRAGPGWSPGRRTRRAGQQRAHLLGAAGVVQHHQHPPAGQQGAVQAGRLVDVSGICGRPARRGERSTWASASTGRSGGVRA